MPDSGQAPCRHRFRSIDPGHLKVAATVAVLIGSVKAAEGANSSESIDSTSEFSKIYLALETEVIIGSDQLQGN